MAAIELNPDNSFAVRPKLGARFRCNKTNELFTVGASWPNGVVFEQHRSVRVLALYEDFSPADSPADQT